MTSANAQFILSRRSKLELSDVLQGICFKRYAPAMNMRQRLIITYPYFEAIVQHLPELYQRQDNFHCSYLSPFLFGTARCCGVISFGGIFFEQEVKYVSLGRS